MTTESNRASSDRLLRRALGANAAFSGLSALACMVGAAALAARLGVDAGLLRSLGVELALFAGILTFLATRRDLGRPWARAATVVIIALDALWVIASAAVLLGGGSGLTVAGQWTVGLVALAVADLAFFQAVGWRRLGREAVAVAA